MLDIISDSPRVELTKAFTSPYDNAVATARTCYSSKIIFDQDVSKSDKAIALRDKIAKSTYLAGHHTTLQHAHFQFAFDNVSRQALWSFFHSHPFYNSEQVSQRYVAVKQGRTLIPKFASESLTQLYNECIEAQQKAYLQLVEELHPIAQESYFEIYRGRRKNAQEKKWQNAIKKRCQEVARYVLPIATYAHLYHTVSGLTLHRYHRLSQSLDCPLEQKLIISAMVEEVNKLDPLFFRDIEDSMPLEETLEAKFFAANSLQLIDSQNAQQFNGDFDQALENKTAKLVSATPNAEQVMAQALRQTLCLSPDKLSDEQAVQLLLSPTKNSYLGEALNLMSLGKISRALDLVHFTFMKKISHSADCQAQRHRMIPGTRPILSRTINLAEPDYITPKIFEQENAKAAKKIYQDIHEKTYDTMRQLHKLGASAESLQYLLTNAHPIRFTDSASLMDHLHKWTTRLCYNAQEEIWQSAKDEVLEVKQHAPMIAKYLLPPCGLRKLTGHTPLCPEGDRFCGVQVWKQKVEDYRRLL